MPTFSCGVSLALSVDHIPGAGFVWFDCPSGHFWYQSPDLVINKPPFPRGTTVLCDWVHAPVPRSPREMTRYVRVVHVDVDAKEYWWEGDWLDTFKPPADFTSADVRLWESWTGDDDAIAFLNHGMAKCAAQADSLLRNSNKLPAFHQANSPPEATDVARQIRDVAQELNALDRSMEAAFARQDEAAAARVFDSLLRVEAQADYLTVIAGPKASHAFHLHGWALRMLKKWPQAERSFRQALQLAPFQTDSWLELCWCCSEQGKLGEAEQAARRAIQVKRDSAAAWGNLAMVLIQQGRKMEARQALDKAISLNPNDQKNQYIAENFDRYFDT